MHPTGGDDLCDAGLCVPEVPIGASTKWRDRMTVSRSSRHTPIGMSASGQWPCGVAVMEASVHALLDVVSRARQW